jgi:single-stranded-DNA-specific exonuclease
MIESAAKRWHFASKPTTSEVAKLAEALNINKVLAALLIQRGIHTFDEAKHFFRPQLVDLHDPFLMQDMGKAIERIEKAIATNEKILIYGDYDVDGTTAVSLVYTFFKSFYAHIDFYIPHRYAEGYGISIKGIDYAAENNFSLIIALDCGIKSIDKVNYALDKKVDFIICDHHRPGDVIPNAVAVLDPKREDCSYPYKELTGCGIGFKLIQAWAASHNINLEYVYSFLDLVAVSTAADIVPITGENRILAYYGLKAINTQPRAGILALLQDSTKYKFDASQRRDLSISDLVFLIGPRINAAGRMDDAKVAVKLLIADNSAQAQQFSTALNEHNTERRDFDSRITEQALQMISENPKFVQRKSTVLFNADWHKGVIGIVASRLTEKYYRPTIILTESNGYATGSARSVKDFDIYNAIESCSDLLTQFGGHMYAAGLTMKTENVEKFVDRFEEVVSETIEDRMLIQQIDIDATLNLEEITPAFFNVLKQFAPFGPGNMSPVFATESVRDTGWSKQVGKNLEHLKIAISQSENGRFGKDGVAFGMGHMYPLIARKIPFDICYSIEENYFNGNVSLQLNVKDIKLQ